MKTKFTIIIFTFIFLVSIVTAANVEDMDFNVPSGFEHVDDAEGLQFVDDINKIRIRIFDADDNDWDSGYEKYNETVVVMDETSTLGDYTIYTLSYGEFIKIDGKEYWVEISSDDLENRNAEKCLDTLEYFNEHNSFEWANA